MSVLVFVLTYSIATKEFPPKIENLKKTVAQIQALIDFQKQLAVQIQQGQTAADLLAQKNVAPTQSAQEVQVQVQNQIQKNKLENLDGDYSGPPHQAPAVPAHASAFPESKEYLEILRRLTEMELGLNHLRTQVNNIESAQRAQPNQAPVRR